MYLFSLLQISASSPEFQLEQPKPEMAISELDGRVGAGQIFFTRESEKINETSVFLAREKERL